jgi:hypothetical protein
MGADFKHESYDQSFSSAFAFAAQRCLIEINGGRRHWAAQSSGKCCFARKSRGSSPAVGAPQKPALVDRAMRHRACPLRVPLCRPDVSGLQRPRLAGSGHCLSRGLDQLADVRLGQG